MNDVFYKPIFSIISVNVHWMIHILAIIVDKHVNINDVSPDKKWDMILSIFSECNTCKDIRFEISCTYTRIYLKSESSQYILFSRMN